MKDELRRKIKEKRDNLSRSDVIKKSEKIKISLFEMDLFQNSKTILFYVSYGNEVYTYDMIKESLALNKIVVAPKSNTIDNSLILSRLTDWSDLEIGAYNILEPKIESIKEVDISSIDLIIVPGVVFDLSGNRIGHGKGYYDRLLNSANNISSIGLAYQFQIVNYIKSEKHDEKIDFIITEDKILKSS